MTSNTVLVQCDNADCAEHRRLKEVGLPHLGQNVYARPTLVCGECGRHLSQVSGR